VLEKALAESQRVAEELDRRAKELSSLLRVSQALSATLDLETVLQTTTDSAIELLGMGSAAIYLVEGEQLCLRATTPPLPPQLPEAFRIARLHDHPHIEKCVSTRLPIILADTESEELTASERAIVEARNLRTIFYVPILVEKRTPAVLILGATGRPRSISEAEIDLARTAANLIAVSIENAMLHATEVRQAQDLRQAEQALRRSEHETSLRNRVLEVLAKISDERMYAEVLEIALQETGSQLGTFGYFDENGAFVIPAITRRAYWDQCDVPEKELIFERGSFLGIWSRAIEKECTLVTNSGPFQVPDGHVPIRNTLVTPVLFKGRVISAIQVANKSSDYDDEDRRVLEVIADQLAPVMHARGERDRQRAERQELEGQFEQAQKLESLGVLAGGVAHDFNNLLAGMLGHSELALSKLAPDHAACANIDGAVKAAERASHLSRQMLAYAGRGQFEFKSTDLSKLVREILHLLEAAVKKNVQLSTRPAQTPALIRADLGQLQQVAMNLVINAAEAIGEKSGRVSIATGFETLADGETRYSIFTASTLEPGQYVFLEVADDGSGIDAKTLSKLFDPFFTTKFLGRGLGLSAVLGIVRGHKGGIEVKTEPGKGTTFRLVFPAAEELRAAGKAVGAQGRLEGTVLVIDDEEVVRTILGEILTAEGLTVLTAEDGAAGLALYEERRTEICLVMLDYSMPEMGGAETFKELRKVNPGVPILLSSGFGQEEVTQRFEDGSLTGFIQKPYRRQALMAEIRRCLG